jgi:hypothetical protein
MVCGLLFCGELIHVASGILSAIFSVAMRMRVRQRTIASIAFRSPDSLPRTNSIEPSE